MQNNEGMGTLTEAYMGIANIKDNIQVLEVPNSPQSDKLFGILERARRRRNRYRARCTFTNRRSPQPHFDPRTY